MGSVYRRGNKWYLNYKLADGRRKQLVTDANTKAAAQKIIAELEKLECRNEGAK